MGTARVTFIINEQGVIEEIIEKVDTRNHTDQILKGNSAASAKPTGKRPAPKKTAAKKKVSAPKKAAKKSPKKNVKKNKGR
jgi:peroxiredoxin Q/BCP